MLRCLRPFRLFRPIARPGHLRSGLCLYAIILTLFCQALTGFTPVSASTNSADDRNRTSIASTTPVSAAKSANNFYFTNFEADYYLSRAAENASPPSFPTPTKTTASPASSPTPTKTVTTSPSPTTALSAPSSATTANPKLPPRLSAATTVTMSFISVTPTHIFTAPTPTS